MASQKVLEHYLAQLRRIEQHREKWCEENVRRHYRDLNKDLQEFLGVQYAELAENDQLTYEILHKKGQYARFIEEVEQRVNKFTPEAAQEIKNTVQLTYKKCFEGMVDAVEKSKDYEQLKVNLKGVRAVTPDVVKNVVKNSFLEDALEKNHKTVIYDIKQQIGIGLTQGDRMSTMAKRISEQIDSDYKKSVRIARTECHRVREAGFQDSSERISQKLQESGSDYVMTKTWKTMQDLSVRPYRKKGKKGFVMGKGPNHVKMEGVTVLVDEEFDLGDGNKAKTPGQSGVAGHDINCRCYLSRDLMTKAEFEKLTGKKIESKPVIKPKEDEILETQEQALLNEKANLEQEKEKYIKRQQNLESYQYDGIWKETVTPADYETKKDKIQAKRDYFKNDIDAAKNRTGKYANTNFYSDNDLQTIMAKHQKHLNDLDNFEAQGKTYLKLSKQIKTIDDKLLVMDDDIKTVRAQIMKVKGIDVKKMESEIDDLVVKIANINKPGPIDYSSLYDLDILYGEKGKGYFTDEMLKEEMDDKWSYLKGKKASGQLNVIAQQHYDILEKFFNEKEKLEKANINNTQLAKLQKRLKDKQDELNKVIKRYGLEDDKFSQKRKDAAYWFKDKAEADKVIRPHTGEIWQKATRDERLASWDYTAGSGKFNRPLRGYDDDWYTFKGVGNVPLDNEGAEFEIKHLTKLIDKSTYDFDIWLQRGVESQSGATSFLGITDDIFNNASEKDLQDLLVGKTVKDEAFVSCGTAKGEGFRGPLILNVYAPKGTKMIYAEPFSNYGLGGGKNWDGKAVQSAFGGEFETIIQRGTSFKITKVEKSNGRLYVDVDIVKQI